MRIYILILSLVVFMYYCLPSVVTLRHINAKLAKDLYMLGCEQNLTGTISEVTKKCSEKWDSQWPAN